MAGRAGSGRFEDVARRLEDEKERLRAHFGRELQQLEDALYREQLENAIYREKSQHDRVGVELAFAAEVKSLEEQLDSLARVHEDSIKSDHKNHASQRRADQELHTAELDELRQQLEHAGSENTRLTSELEGRAADVARLEVQLTSEHEEHAAALRSAELGHETRLREAQQQAALALSQLTAMQQQQQLAQLASVQQQQQLSAEQQNARGREHANALAEHATTRQQLTEARERTHELNSEVAELERRVDETGRRHAHEVRMMHAQHEQDVLAKVADAQARLHEERAAREEAMRSHARRQEAAAREARERRRAAVGSQRAARAVATTKRVAAAERAAREESMARAAARERRAAAAREQQQLARADAAERAQHAAASAAESAAERERYAAESAAEREQHAVERERHAADGAAMTERMRAAEAEVARLEVEMNRQQRESVDARREGEHRQRELAQSRHSEGMYAQAAHALATSLNELSRDTQTYLALPLAATAGGATYAGGGVASATYAGGGAAATLTVAALPCRESTPAHAAPAPFDVAAPLAVSLGSQPSAVQTDHASSLTRAPADADAVVSLLCSELRASEEWISHCALEERRVREATRLHEALASRMEHMSSAMHPPHHQPPHQPPSHAMPPPPRRQPSDRRTPQTAAPPPPPLTATVPMEGITAAPALGDSGEDEEEEDEEEGAAAAAAAVAIARAGMHDGVRDALADELREEFMEEVGAEVREELRLDGQVAFWEHAAEVSEYARAAASAAAEGERVKSELAMSRAREEGLADELSDLRVRPRCPPSPSRPLVALTYLHWPSPLLILAA